MAEKKFFFESSATYFSDTANGVKYDLEHTRKFGKIQCGST